MLGSLSDAERMFMFSRIFFLSLGWGLEGSGGGVSGGGGGVLRVCGRGLAAAPELTPGKQGSFRGQNNEAGIKV